MPAATAPSAPPGPTLLGHPRGLFLLFLTEMWERFSYYGMRSLLVLYLIRQATGDNPGRGWSKAEAGNLYGWYTGLAYLAPLLGGIIADRLLGTHRSLLVGGILVALGHVVLALSGLGAWAHDDLGVSIFITGLALIIIGTGHFKPSVSVMVGQLYAADDPRRDGAFTIFYMGINLGAWVCTYVCGTLGERYDWHLGFGAAAVGMLIGLALYVLLRPRWLPGIGTAASDRPATARWFLAGGTALALAIGALFHSGTFAALGRAVDAFWGTGRNAVAMTIVMVALLLSWCWWFVRRQAPAERGPTASILILVLFNTVFWLGFEQAGSSLNIFAAENTDRMVAGWLVPATWFQSINPLLIILLGPLFALTWSWLARHRRNPSQPMKVALALFLVGGGYLFMVAGSLQAAGGTKVAMFWLAATYALHTCGELCLSPTGLAFVSRVAPVRSVSFLMGVYFLANVIAGKVGGMLSAQVEDIEQGRLALFWYPWFRLGGQADFYLIFVLLAGGAGMVILLLTPLLKRLIGTADGDGTR